MQANQSPTFTSNPANPTLTRLAKRALKAYRLTSNPHRTYRTWIDEVRARNRLDHIFREMEKQDPPISYSELQREIARLESLPSAAQSASQSYPSSATTHHVQR